MKVIASFISSPSLRQGLTKRGAVDRNTSDIDSGDSLCVGDVVQRIGVKDQDAETRSGDDRLGGCFECSHFYDHKCSLHIQWGMSFVLRTSNYSSASIAT